MLTFYEMTSFGKSSHGSINSDGGDRLMLTPLFEASRLDRFGLGARERLEKTEPASSEALAKYQSWYDDLIRTRRYQNNRSVYTEVHHIVPRSLGGSDDSLNLVRLSYREHFIAHWLLTKIHTGADLIRMQRALWAMAIPSNGIRMIAAWQFDVAKRAIRDLYLARIALRAKSEARAEARRIHSLAFLSPLEQTTRSTSELLKSARLRKSNGRRRPRPGKRQRMALRTANNQHGR